MRTYSIDYRDYDPITMKFLGMCSISVFAKTEKEAITHALQELTNENKMATLSTIEHITEKMKVDFLKGVDRSGKKVKKI